MPTCTHCDQPKRAKGLCETHYRRQRRGLPLDEPIRQVLTNASVEDRLAAYVDRRGENECWPWTRGCDPDGYGDISVGGGKHRRAHVVAWEVANGRPCPADMCVMHTCDNPPCCNAAHLILGTIGDNNRDRHAKGRSAHQKGSRHGMAKLNEEQVLQIRQGARDGGTSRELAREFGVSQATVSLIVNRKTWTHV